jgi:RHS repeat-associated protein
VTALYALEKGQFKGYYNFAAGDLFRIERTNGVVKYYQNGNLLYTSLVPSTTALMVDVGTDALGTSIENIRTSFTSKPASTIITNYLRDASGNVMAIYQSPLSGGEGTGLPAGQAGVRLIEQPIYGSSRLGMYTGGRKEGQRRLGQKNYELSNHLGNVLTVITDNINMSATDGVYATVVSATDYYPFGLEMEGRTFSDEKYRYGFNGKEKDNSFASTNNYDYGFRIYNPKIAKFLSVDPLTKKYPELTPYQFASNRPIDGIDLDGLEWTVHEIDDGTNTYIGITLDVAILNSTGGSRYDEFALQSAVAKQLQNSYTFSETQTGSSGKSGVFDVIITVNVRTIIDKKYLSNTELLIDVRNQNDPEVKNLYGKASSIGGSTVYLNEKYIPGIISGSDNNTVPHEVGHTGGLLHIDALSTRLQDLLPWTENQYYNDSEQKNNPDNAMYEGGSGKINDKTSIKINKEQIKIIATEYKEGDINKKD